MYVTVEFVVEVEDMDLVKIFSEQLDHRQRVRKEARWNGVMNEQAQETERQAEAGWECYAPPSAGVVVEVPVTLPVEPPVDTSDAALGDAITAYAQRHGFQTARALLDEFGVMRAGEVPAERRVEFIGRTGTES
jgi:hypothetical protein